MRRLAYLLAASHSGSTLLAMILGAHRDAVTVGELKATSLGNPDQYRCSCGAFLKACDFWTKVNTRMTEKGIPFQITNARTSIHEVPSRFAARLLQPLYRPQPWETARDLALSLSPTWRRHLSETQQRNGLLVETLHELTGAKVVIDSSKQALRLKYLLRQRDLDIRVIRLIRDGRGVSLTYMDEWNFADSQNPAMRKGGTGDISARRLKPMSAAAREWRRSNEAQEALLKTLRKDQYIEVRYEDYCTDQAKVLDRIYTFLGLDPEGRIGNFRAVEKHVIGNGCRFDSTPEIRIDERWKEHLTPHDLETFEAIAGDLNRRYGYR